MTREEQLEREVDRLRAIVTESVKNRILGKVKASPIKVQVSSSTTLYCSHNGNTTAHNLAPEDVLTIDVEVDIPYHA
jgi:hypothetical protein